MQNWPPVAGVETQNRDAAIQPFAGEAPIVTDSAPALANVAYLQLCALTTTGITPFVTATHTAAQAVIAAANATTGEGAPYYDAGKFNHEAITWPASLNTLALRKAYLNGTMIKVGHLLPN